MDLLSLRDYLNVGLESLFLIVVVLVLTIFVARTVNMLLKRGFNKSSKILKVNPTHYSFLRHIVSALIYLLGLGVIIYMIPSLRSLSTTLFAGAGILAVVVGFASQAAFSNIVSGIFIVIFKPFRVGDRITIGVDTRGIVEDITLRHTVIKNFENKRIIIPNSIISNEKIENSNIEDSKICKFMDFGISYDSDVDKAKKIMQTEAEKHRFTIDNRNEQEKNDKEPLVVVRVIGFGDSSVNIRAYIWTENPANAWVLGCELNESIKKKFDKAGIEIPFPHRTIVMKK